MMLLSRIITLSLLLEKYLRLESKSEKKDPRIHNSAWPSANSTNCLKYISSYHFRNSKNSRIFSKLDGYEKLENGGIPR